MEMGNRVVLPKRCFFGLAGAAFLVLILGPWSGRAEALPNPLKDLEAQAAADPDSADLQHALGLAYLDSGRVDEAKGCFQKEAKIHKNGSGAKLGLALCQIAAGKFDVAKATCRALPRSKLADRNVCLGYVFMAFGRASLAEDSFRDILKADPDSGPALAGLGDALWMQQKADQALEAYHKAIQADPNNGRALLGRAQIRLRQGNASQAVSDLEQAVRSLQGWATPYLHLGRARGPSPQGVEALRTAVAVNPGFGEAWQDLGQMLVDIGSTEEGVSALKRAVEIDPRQALAHQALGLVLLKLQRFLESRSALAQAVSLLGTLPRSHEGLGDIEAEQKGFDKAIGHYKDASNLVPGEIRLLLKLGDMHYRLGKYTLASSYLDKVLAQDPRNSLAHHLLGRILCERREFEPGRSHLDQALQGDGKGIDRKVVQALKDACVSKP